MKAGMDAKTHFDKLKRLLDKEAEAEKEAFKEALLNKDREGQGVALRSLEILEEHGGLGGRHVIVLKKRGRGPLPWTTLDAGSPVFLSADDRQLSFSVRGTVLERNEHSIHVVFDEPLEETDACDSLRLDLAFDETSRKRERYALERAASAEKNRTADLRAVLLGERAPRFLKADERPPLNFFNEALDETQKAAVRLCLGAQDVAVVHGPPGTGKTTTLVEIIRQAIQEGKKLLVSAPSNLGVDNLLEKLMAAGEKPVRIGHPARVMPHLRERSLDFLVEHHDDVRLARKMQKEAAALFRQAHRFTRSPPPRGTKQSLFQEARALIADARKLEARAVERVLDDAPVLCATLTGSDGFVMGKRRFDLLIIDEAGQSTEPAAWIPLVRADALILGGDHQQLPPNLQSAEAEEQGLGISLMERLVKLYEGQITSRLSVQYRMHEAIMHFSSHEFYEASLIAHESVKAHRLCDLPQVLASPLTEAPLHFIDTAGAGFQEEEEGESGSRLNRSEAAYLAKIFQKLSDDGVAAGKIAIIAPYAAQVRYLRELLPVAGLEIDTVDGFQGREKEAILLTLVRSNENQELGFLKEVRRLNVALTRARRFLLVIGDSATLGSDPFFQRLLTSMEDHEAYRSIWEDAPDMLMS